MLIISRQKIPTIDPLFKHSGGHWLDKFTGNVDDLAEKMLQVHLQLQVKIFLSDLRLKN